MTNAALVAKLEKAEEGTRELDIAVAEALRKVMLDWAKDDRAKAGQPRVGEGFRPTRNLQCAVDLVPEGWSSGRVSWPGRDSGYLKANARADLYHDSSSGGEPRETGFGATPALALSICILKAIETECPDG